MPPPPARPGPESSTTTTTTTRYCCTPADVDRAAATVAGAVRRTPVLTSASLDLSVPGDGDGDDERGDDDGSRAGSARSATTTRRVRVRCAFKCESFQRTGSFKFRGAANAVANAPRGTRVVCTVSSGNFAQALALAARERGLESVVVMPSNTTPVKVEAVRGFGGRVVFCAPERRDEALREVVAGLGPGAVAVHPSDAEHVIAGQGTVFGEFEAQAREALGAPLDAVLVPVGGGGVISGVAVAASGRAAGRVLVLGAEPRLADDAHRSRAAGALQGHRDGRVPATVAEGLRTTLGPNTFPIVRDLVAEIFLVDEDEIRRATVDLMYRLKVVVEPSSATTYAALRTPQALSWLASRFPGRDEIRVGCVLTGGNVDLTGLFGAKI